MVYKYTLQIETKNKEIKDINTLKAIKNAFSVFIEFDNYYYIEIEYFYNDYFYIIIKELKKIFNIKRLHRYKIKVA